MITYAGATKGLRLHAIPSNPRATTFARLLYPPSFHPLLSLLTLEPHQWRPFARNLPTIQISDVIWRFDIDAITAFMAGPNTAAVAIESFFPSLRVRSRVLSRWSLGYVRRWLGRRAGRWVERVTWGYLIALGVRHAVSAVSRRVNRCGQGQRANEGAGMVIL